MNFTQNHTYKIILGTVLAIAGIIMLFIGLYCPPLGAIEPSVLAAYGEVSTFSAALIGIDALYRFQFRKLVNEHEREVKKMNDSKNDNEDE